MTTYDDLDDDVRETARQLQDAFGGVHLDRPSPATSPEQDAETASRVAAAFDGVSLDAPAPSRGSAPAADLVVLPASRRRRRWPVLISAAAAAAVVGAAVLLGPSGSTPAWASEPRTTSPSDVEAVGAACAAPLARGLGDLQASGAVSVDGAPVDAPAPGALAGPPTTLPPLVALDVRGDVAFAVFQDAAWTVTCVAVEDGGAWRDQGVQVGPGSSGQQPGVVSGGGTATVAGQQITTVSGVVPAGTARVTFRLDDGTQVRASVVGTTWAAWFPGDRRLDPTSITAYAASGSATPLG